MQQLTREYKHLAIICINTMLCKDDLKKLSNEFNMVLDRLEEKIMQVAYEYGPHKATALYKNVTAAEVAFSKALDIATLNGSYSEYNIQNNIN